VWVELDGPPQAFRISLVRPMCQRQPADTHWEPFDAINETVDDVVVEDCTQGTLQLWLGYCCLCCTPNPMRVRFEGVTHLQGLGEDVDFCNPLFRLASLAEIHAHSIPVPSECRAFCIVTSHGQGRDGPPIFVVAQSAAISMPEPGFWPT
jgi:hypothetical protein